MIKLDYTQTEPFLAAGDLEHFAVMAARADKMLESGSGAGSEYLGWLHLPSSIGKNMTAAIGDAAQELRSKSQVIIVIGIGGSYLGSRAAIEALGGSFDFLKKGDHTRVVFAGHNLSEEYLRELMDAVQDYSLGAIAVSKSGTTLEPALALNIVKAEIERRYGRKESARRIITVTDSRHGALRSLSAERGYRSFAIPDDVGGRFSIFTPAGLLPMAAAGIEIAQLIGGAASMEQALGAGVPLDSNPALQYAAARNALYTKGFKIELLAFYEPKLYCVGEWWRQLFSESEGKQGKGIFTATANYTADLHSMGQYIQEGERMVFETVLSISESGCRSAEGSEGNRHGTDNLSRVPLGEMNTLAERAVTMAHVAGGVPNIKIGLPQLSPHWLGALFYLFERACAVSGYISGINPFDQPGVEAYKKNLNLLLDRQ